MIVATGRVGSEIVRGVLARGDTVAALVRDPGNAGQWAKIVSSVATCASGSAAARRRGRES